jgi:hypothetical protein
MFFLKFNAMDMFGDMFEGSKPENLKQNGFDKLLGGMQGAANIDFKKIIESLKNMKINDFTNLPIDQLLKQFSNFKDIGNYIKSNFSDFLRPEKLSFLIDFFLTQAKKYKNIAEYEEDLKIILIRLIERKVNPKNLIIEVNEEKFNEYYDARNKKKNIKSASCLLRKSKKASWREPFKSKLHQESIFTSNQKRKTLKQIIGAKTLNDIFGALPFNQKKGLEEEIKTHGLKEILKKDLAHEILVESPRSNKKNSDQFSDVAIESENEFSDPESDFHKPLQSIRLNKKTLRKLKKYKSENSENSDNSDSSENEKPKGRFSMFKMDSRLEEGKKNPSPGTLSDSVDLKDNFYKRKALYGVFVITGVFISSISLFSIGLLQLIPILTS